MKVILGADHAGVSLKKKIKKYLAKKDIDYEDYGSFNEKSHDDYPDYAFKVAEKVAANKNSKGILICGTGTGMVMAANKLKGIRASLAYDIFSARMARQDNNANVLCLRSRKFLSNKSIKIVDVWLKTDFSGRTRHKRRLDKLKRFERNIKRK